MSHEPSERVAARIGYEFRRPELLVQALTHASYKCENAGAGAGDNQRLEFLGDAVASLIVANLVYGVLGDHGEGNLTVARARLVNNAALARVGVRLGIADALRFGNGVQGGKQSSAANAAEAVLGAVFLDGGFDAAKRVFDAHFAPILLEAAPAVYDNPKSALQERIQKKHKATPVYKTVRAAGGADHMPRFDSAVRFAGEVLGRGTGRSKREAETTAALDALKRLDAGGSISGVSVPSVVNTPAEYADIAPEMLLCTP